MGARAPQDVDLEDRLIYGLSPLRFGYVVVAVLSALGVWRLDVVPAPLRVVLCPMLVIVGAVLAWGRWRSRPVDQWLVDASVFVMRNYRFGLRPQSRGTGRRRAAVIPLRAINDLVPEPGAGQLDVPTTHSSPAA